MTLQHNHNEKGNKKFIFDKKTIGLFFLGVGFNMFLLNIVTIFNFLSLIKNGSYPLTGYYISIVSSIILMAYSIYNIYDEN